MIFVKTTSGKYYTAHVAFELVLVLLKNAVVILLLAFPYNIAFIVSIFDWKKKKNTNTNATYVLSTRITVVGTFS